MLEIFQYFKPVLQSPLLSMCVWTRVSEYPFIDHNDVNGEHILIIHDFFGLLQCLN